MRRIFDDQGLIMDPAPPTIFRDAGESHAKVKARDLVEGWPMSKSTCGGFGSSVDEYEWMERFRLTFLRFNILEADYVLWKLREIEETVSYHRGQQFMVEDFIRSVGSVERFRAICKGDGEAIDDVRVREVRGPSSEPGYWKNEISGTLQPVVTAFINGERLDADGVAIMKFYFRQWIYADVWAGTEEIEGLRRMIDEVATQHGLSSWVDRALDAGIDPL